MGAPQPSSPPPQPYRHRGLALVLVSLMALLCSGCFQYHLTLRFDHQNQGYLQQMIQVGPRTLALAGPAVDTWLQTLESRVRSLGGEVRQTAPDRRLLTVPFSSGPDLERRYRQLLQPSTGAGLEIPDLATVPSQLRLEQANRFFALRNHLILDIDLSNLPRQDPPPPNSPQADSPDQGWLTLAFSLQTPWGVRTTAADSRPGQAGPQQTTWVLEPGQRHHIDVVFWVPSLLGLGSVAIALLVLLGYFLKYGLRRQRLARPKT